MLQPQQATAKANSTEWTLRIVQTTTTETDGMAGARRESEPVCQRRESLLRALRMGMGSIARACLHAGSQAEAASTLVTHLGLGLDLSLTTFYPDDLG